MEHHDEERTTTNVTPGTRVKMVQISIMFKAESDAEALAIKTAISEALKDRQGISLSFGMQER